MDPNFDNRTEPDQAELDHERGLVILGRLIVGATAVLAILVLVAPAPVRLKLVLSVLSAVHTPAPEAALAAPSLFPAKDGAPASPAAAETFERSFFPEAKSSLVAGRDWGAARLEDDGFLASASVALEKGAALPEAALPAGLLPEATAPAAGAPEAQPVLAGAMPLFRPAEAQDGGGRRAGQANRLGLLRKGAGKHEGPTEADVESELAEDLEENLPESIGAGSGNGAQAPGAEGGMASETSGGRPQRAGAGALADLRAGLGREADAIRRDLAVPGLKTVMGWAAKGWPRLASAASQLKHIRADVTTAATPLYYDSPSARVKESLERFAYSLDAPEVGLITVTEGARDGAKASAACLKEMADSELARSTHSVTCHRGLSLALRNAHRLEAQVRDLNSGVAREYFRIRGALTVGGPAGQEDEHLSYWIGDWILAKHVPQLLSALDAKAEREAARRLAARARTRVEEWNKALGPYYETLKSGSGGLKALAAINEAQLHLSMSERFYADVARGEAGPAGLSDGSERAVLAYFAAMRAWRDLVEFEDRRLARAQQKRQGPR